MTQKEKSPSTKRGRLAKVKFDNFSDEDFFNERDDKVREGQINALLARYIMRDGNGKFITPGAAIMVIKEGEVVYETYQGAAKGIAKGEKGYAAINEDTIFDLASVSKQFTAMAIIMLKDQGKLGYDDPLSKFFPSANVPVEFLPQVGRIVTVRHLLNHTSGLKDVITLFTKKKYPDPKIHHHYPRSLRAFQEQAFEPTSRQALERLAGQELAFTPEEMWEYSNSGYIILAQIVESVTGMPFPRFMEENIFRRLGMNNTFVVDEHTEIPVENRVTSYDRGWNDFHDIDYTPLNRIYGDGNVHSTLRDMKKWDHAFQVIFKPENFPGEEPLVKERSIEQAFSRKHPTNLHPAIKYTSGWFFGRYRGGAGSSRPLMWHSGGWAGLRTMILRFFHPKHLTVIVLANNQYLPSGTVACRIAKLFLNEQPSARHDPLELELLEEVVQSYHQENDIVLANNGDDIAYSDDITLEDGELYVKDGYLEKYKLVFSAKVSAEVNKEKAALRREKNEPPADDKTSDDESLVFYMEDLDGNVLEGFDIFRYDIVGNKLFSRASTRSKRAPLLSQRR